LPTLVLQVFFAHVRHRVVPSSRAQPVETEAWPNGQGTRLLNVRGKPCAGSNPVASANDDQLPQLWSPRRAEQPTHPWPRIRRERAVDLHEVSDIVVLIPSFVGKRQDVAMLRQAHVGVSPRDVPATQEAHERRQEKTQAQEVDNWKLWALASPTVLKTVMGEEPIERSTRSASAR
jgi:hypothetical protein